MYKGNLLGVASFYGDTYLRIFHGLQRLSEDWDFLLIAPRASFDFSQYFQPIIDEFALLGRYAEISKKDKNHLGTLKSALHIILR